MKKTSIFLVLISFLLSIFLISFYGLSIRDEHLVSRIQSVEILDCEVIGGIKQKDIELKKDEETVYFIQYRITPDLVTNTQDYKFTIIGGNDTFTQDGITYNFCEINKNRLTFYHECAIMVELRSTDGSNRVDTALFICSESINLF